MYIPLYVNCVELDFKVLVSGYNSMPTKPRGIMTCHSMRSSMVPFEKLILESNNNEVSLSLLVFTAIQTSRGLTLIRASWWACQGLLGI